MIRPVLQDDAFLENVGGARNHPEHLHLWWLGQSGFLIKTSCGCVLLDPYLSDSLTHKYASTDQPHVRMTELAIRPERLDMIDIVTSSHNHTDHLDAETLKPLMRVNPNLKLVLPEANRPFAAARLQIDSWRWDGVPFFIRAGKLIGREYFILEGTEDEQDSEVVGEFLKQFYDQVPTPPQQLLLPNDIEEMKVINEWLNTRRGGDKWNFELNDPLPEFRIRSLHLRGLRDIELAGHADGALSRFDQARADQARPGARGVLAAQANCDYAGRRAGCTV